MHRTAILVVALVGCGGPWGPSKPKPVASTVAVPACPDEETLISDLREIQSTSPMEHLSIDTCVPGHYDLAGWAIAARAVTDDGDARRFYYIQDLQHRPFARAEPMPIDPRSDGAPVTITAADLDDDDIEELLFESSHDEGGVHEAWLTVMKIRGNSLYDVGVLPIGYDGAVMPEDDPGRYVCTASWNLVPGPPPAIAVSTLVTFGEPGESCLPAGVSTFRVVGGQLDPPL